MKGRTTVRKIVSAFTGVTMMFAVGLAAGCGPDGSGNLSSNGPNTDGWGNPIPVGPDGQESCAVPSGRPVVDPPYTAGRPHDVKPGNSWIVFGFSVRALPQEGQQHPLPGEAPYDYCVPIAVHVYTRSGEADTLQIDDVGFSAGPFDFVTDTPWIGRFLGLQYDPTEERFQGRPPTYEVHLLAKYQRERDFAHTEEPLALSCSILIDGAAINTDLAMMPGRDTVECVFKSNDYWRLY
jgi:hypothetical protein